MTPEKNDIVTIRIEDMGNEGEGIGKTDGFPLFVKGAVPGDLAKVKVMKAKKNYGFARLEEVLEPSPHRTVPPCPVANPCGGCVLQHISYEAQLQYKQNKVRNDLVHIGGFDGEFIDQITEPIIGMDNPYRYRNKAQFPIGKDKAGNLIAGFYAGRTHDIIPNRDCMLGVPENQEILDIVLDHMKQHGIQPYDEGTYMGLVRHVLIRKGFATGQLMVCIIINGKKLPYEEELAERLMQLKNMTSVSVNINTGHDNVILGKEVSLLAGKEAIIDKVGDISFSISPLSFYQVNSVQMEKLYKQGLEYAGLTGNETVWDLYCGIGTISLFLAQKAKKVYGVEIVPEAIRDAKQNAEINGISNAEFFVGKAEEVLPEKYREFSKNAGNSKEQTGDKPDGYADVIVVDPPRKGCDAKCLETILSMAPEKVVYISCDPATLARDLRILCDGGYELKHVRVVDQFPQTSHVETVVLLQKVN
ncbi:MAG: 23S rRNA (uracil(1939)-C(5))-methyltransferase RlmD [Lachnospiraceae bacterium]|nr:23S rRNA (uracil(1939)-C(5))-methyltransferase RlmD [Lachnospiraceae bacterium]